MKKIYLVLLILIVIALLSAAGLWLLNTSLRSTTENTDQQQAVTENTNTNVDTIFSELVLDEESCNTSQMFTPPPEAEELPDIAMLIARSNDGVTFTDEGEFLTGGGVPSITQGADGTLVAVFNWFPEYEENPTCYNKVAIKTSADGGKTWEGPLGLYVEDFPENYQLPFDPTITTTTDGSYRLFFTTHVLGMDEPFIYGTAVSADGLHYTYDGIAFQSDDYDIVDGSEVRLGDTWYMIAPMAKQDGAALQATSRDGRSFSLMESNRPTHSMYWVGNMVEVDGEVRFYGSCGLDSGLVGLCYTSTTDGVAWADPVKTNMPNSDPGIAYTDEGEFILIYPEPNAMPLPEDSSDNRNL